MTDPGAGNGSPSPTTASRRMWLQRWVAQGLMTSAQAESIDQYEEVNAVALAPYDTGSADQVLRGWIHRWSTVGYITAQQADAIVSDVAATQQPGAYATTVPSGTPVGGPAPVGQPSPPPAPKSGSSLAVVSEVLGYLGAALAIGASFWLMRNVWPDIDPVIQAGIAGGAALLLTVAGFLIRIEGIAAFKRLRIVVWLASTAVTGAFGAVIALQFVPTDYPLTVIAWIGGLVAVQSIVLWQFRNRPAHQLTALLGLVAAVFFGVAVGGDWAMVGVALFVVGVVLVGLGFADSVRLSEITLTIGAGTVAIAALPFLVDTKSFALVLGSSVCAVMVFAAAIKAVPLRTSRRLVFGIVGIMAGVIYAPLTIIHFAQSGATGIGVAVALIGLALVALAFTDLVYVPEVSELIGGGGAIVGVALIGIDADGIAPIIGVALAVMGILLGNRAHRVALIVVSWIGFAIFCLWELIWIGVRVNVGAVAALIAGAVLVSVAVFLSRRASARSRRERAAMAESDERSPEPPAPSGPPPTWQ